MKKQGKRQKNNVPKVEPRSLLPCSTDVMRGSTLGFTDKEQAIETQINVLAKIIVDAYVFSKRTKDD
jgi:hypothetical protein